MKLSLDTNDFETFHHSSKPAQSHSGVTWRAGLAPASDERGALAELAEDYRRMGYEAGYSQAARDQLETLVVTAESILRDQPATFSGQGETRRLLYAFIAHIERRLGLFTAGIEAPTPSSDDYVDGGLGI